MSFSYVGDQPLSRQTGERYFYALRRDDDGQLFISKVDVASPTDNIQINKPVSYTHLTLPTICSV